MKINLTFVEKDFSSFRDFEKAVKKQLGPKVYVGTDNLCFYFDYPKKLVEQLRPTFGTSVQLEFELDSSCPSDK